MQTLEMLFWGSFTFSLCQFNIQYFSLRIDVHLSTDYFQKHVKENSRKLDKMPVSGHSLVDPHSSSVKIRYCERVIVCMHWTEEEMYNSFLYQTTDNRVVLLSYNSTIYTSLGPRPKTNPSADCFQYRYTGSNIHAGWGLGTRLYLHMIRPFLLSSPEDSGNYTPSRAVLHNIYICSIIHVLQLTTNVLA